MTNKHSRPRVFRAHGPSMTVLRMRATIGVVALAALTGVLTMAASASAETRHRLWSAATHKCVYNVPSGNVYSGHCDATGAITRWYFHQWNDGTWRIRNAGTGLCLDDSLAYGLRTFHCHAGSSPYSRYQSWYLRGGDFKEMRNQATGRCLDDSVYGVRALHCNGLVYQLFSLLSP